MTADKVQNYRDNGNLFCLDGKEFDYDIFGSTESGKDFAVLEIALLPCATKVEVTGVGS